MFAKLHFNASLSDVVKFPSIFKTKNKALFTLRIYECRCKYAQQYARVNDYD